MGGLTLPATGTILLDSAPLIYVVEKHPLYAALLSPLWLRAKKGELTLVLSEMALSEALVAPLRQNDSATIQAYETIANESGFRVEAVTWQILRRAADLRAHRTGLRMPDAIQIATAGFIGCDAFVTNDKSLRSADLSNVIIVDDLIQS